MKIEFLDLKSQYASIQEDVKKTIEELLKKQVFILGEEVKILEEQVARYSGAKCAVGCASGSDALLLSLMALDIRQGDEVITTPFTFFATAGAIYRTGAKIVFVDIDPRTFNIDVKKIEEKVTKNTKAIIPVHLFGQCADMDPIMALAKKHNFKVIEDAAQSIGAVYKGKRSGSMGDTGCLSFFPSKNLGGYGDGGMVLTNDEGLCEKLKVLRVHGSKNKYFHSIVGFNSRLDTIQAAILIVKLKYLDKWNSQRREKAGIYNELFKGSKAAAPYIEPFNESVYNQYVIRVQKRDELMKLLKENEVGCAVYYPLPLHLQACFADLGCKEGDFPESEKASKEVLALPIYPELSLEKQQFIAKLVRDFVDGKK